MKKTMLLVAFIVVLACFVSCNPDSIMKTGKFLSKTGVTVLGANVSNEKAEEVANLIKEIAVLSDDPEDVSAAAEKSQTAINLIQQIKSSPKMVEALQEELKKPVEVKEKVYEDKQNIVITTNIVFDLVDNIDTKMNKITEIANVIASASDLNSLRAAFTGTDIAPLLEDDLTAEAILQLKPYMDNVKEYSDNAQGFVDKYLGPFTGFISELNDASVKMKDSMPEVENGSVPGIALMNGILGEKLVNDVIGSIVEVAVSTTVDDGTDKIIETMSNLIRDLDSISVVNPEIKFSSLDSLTSNVLDFVGGLNK